MSGILQRSVPSTANVFTEPQQFNAQVTLAGQTADTGESAMTRDLVDARTMPFPSRQLGGLPPYRFFDDFIAQSDISELWTWSTAGGSSGFGRQGDIAGFSSRAFGVAELVAYANSSYTRCFYNMASPSNLPGLRMEAVLAIPDLSSTAMSFGVAGGGGAFQLLYDSTKYSGNWHIYDSDGGYFNTGIAATAGDFKSGDRWRAIVERLGPYNTSITLERAAWNSGNWSSIYTTVYGHDYSMGRFFPIGPMIGVTSTTSSSRSVRFDYVAYSHSMKR
ncbi:hypothetical protein [Luteolibacter sp. LG18]|uniref:hypothetical protein n=1 Tax=Luteolibacter sp. LG18 TaxID=2819286 RepID=UPI002B27F8A3|nr:hypothetical protein llg_25960 [Luteolibacter sp. LG18]